MNPSLALGPMSRTVNPLFLAAAAGDGDDSEDSGSGEDVDTTLHFQSPIAPVTVPTKTLGGGDADDGAEDDSPLRKSIGRVMVHPLWRAAGAVFTVVALFLPDLARAVGPPSMDLTVSTVMAVTLVFLATEVALQGLADPKCCLRPDCWLDILATLSIAADVAAPGSDSRPYTRLLTLARAARAARFAARMAAASKPDGQSEMLTIPESMGSTIVNSSTNVVVVGVLGIVLGIAFLSPQSDTAQLQQLVVRDLYELWASCLSSSDGCSRAGNSPSSAMDCSPQMCESIWQDGTITSHLHLLYVNLQGSEIFIGATGALRTSEVQECAIRTATGLEVPALLPPRRTHLLEISLAAVGNIACVAQVGQARFDNHIEAQAAAMRNVQMFFLVTCIVAASAFVSAAARIFCIAAVLQTDRTLPLSVAESVSSRCSQRSGGPGDARAQINGRVCARVPRGQQRRPERRLDARLENCGKEYVVSGRCGGSTLSRMNASCPNATTVPEA